MTYVMDMHTHTIASGHAYSTLQENIAAAKEKGRSEERRVGKECSSFV